MPISFERGEGPPVITDRLELRPPVESDRSVFVSLFCDQDFMVFSGGAASGQVASERFDHMLAAAAEIPFAKRPIVVRASGEIVGYCGADWFDFEGDRRLEFGYRLVPGARGQGIGFEAGTAMLALADQTAEGELVAMIDPVNRRSQRLARRLGFRYWKMVTVDGFHDQFWRLSLPRRGANPPPRPGS